MASKKPGLKPGSGNQRLQPIRATRPFQLRQGSPARYSPSSSPTSMVSRPASDPRRNRWQTDHRTSPDRAERRSPSSPSMRVMNRRSPSPRVCRNSSMDSVPALTGTYLTGQWPRDPQNTAPSSLIVPNHGASSNKSTQTPDWNSDFSVQQTKGSKSLPSRSVIPEEVKQMKQQMRRIAKRQEKKERLSPVHGNHAALPQSQSSQTRSMSNPIPIFGRTPKRQNSLESLNKEIENIIIKDSNEGSVRFPLQGLTPPDGHRAPIMRSSTTRTMETQTSGLVQDGTIANGGSHSPSPSLDQQSSFGPYTLKVSDTGLSPGPKYASSPRPNNSYMFQREPPEGAESVKPFKEQDVQCHIVSSCPDKQKVHFHPSSNGSFSKFQKFAVEEQNNNGTNGTCLVNGSTGNCANPKVDQVDFDFQERRSGAGSDSQDLTTSSLMA